MRLYNGEVRIGCFHERTTHATFSAGIGLLLAGAGSVQANGLLIPEEKSVPPLAMLNHKVNIAIEDQVAVTRVEQTFRNHTDRNCKRPTSSRCRRALNVNKFTMWVNGKETKGELLEARRPAPSTPVSFAARRIPACSNTWATTCCK